MQNTSSTCRPSRRRQRTKVRCAWLRCSPRAYVSFCTHACFCSQWWSFKQAGHCSGILISDSDSNLIFSVLRPVGTVFPVVGHRIIILGMIYSITKPTWHSRLSRGAYHGRSTPLSVSLTRQTNHANTNADGVRITKLQSKYVCTNRIRAILLSKRQNWVIDCASDTIISRKKLALL